jgi:hypothetical protein
VIPTIFRSPHTRLRADAGGCPLTGVCPLVRYVTYRSLTCTGVGMMKLDSQLIQRRETEPTIDGLSKAHSDAHESLEKLLSGLCVNTVIYQERFTWGNDRHKTYEETAGEVHTCMYTEIACTRTQTRTRTRTSTSASASAFASTSASASASTHVQLYLNLNLYLHLYLEIDVHLQRTLTVPVSALSRVPGYIVTFTELFMVWRWLLLLYCASLAHTAVAHRDYDLAHWPSQYVQRRLYMETQSSPVCLQSRCCSIAQADTWLSWCSCGSPPAPRSSTILRRCRTLTAPCPGTR